MLVGNHREIHFISVHKLPAYLLTLGKLISVYYTFISSGVQHVYITIATNCEKYTNRKKIQSFTGNTLCHLKVNYTQKKMTNSVNIIQLLPLDWPTTCNRRDKIQHEEGLF